MDGKGALEINGDNGDGRIARLWVGSHWENLGSGKRRKHLGNGNFLLLIIYGK